MSLAPSLHEPLPPSRRAARASFACAPLARAAVAAVAIGTLAACISRPHVGPGREPGAAPSAGDPLDRTARRGGPSAADMSAVWSQMGLIAPRGDVPFVGQLGFFASPSADTTYVLLSLSLSNRALTFTREGDRYRAPYEVRLEVRRNGASVRQLSSNEVVRVATFKETTRTDESVLFYQYLPLPPGQYSLALAVRDAESGRSATADVPVVVPRLGAGALGSPTVAYEAIARPRLDTFPNLLVSPRAAAVFGQDSLVPVYVEAYGVGGAAAPAQLPVRATVRGERGAVVWTDSVALERRGAATATATAATPALYSGLVRVPVPRIGIGVVSLDVTRPGGVPGARDSVRTPLFVSLGDDLPVAGFDEMLSYLRYYALPERIQAMRDAPPERRAAAWAAFVRETDPVPGTGAHEGLRDYFARIRAANVRFGEEGTAGWLTDRGMAFVGIGEPDQIFDPNNPDANARGRQQIWEYREPRLQLVFVDQTGFGRWRLTPAGLSDVQSIIRRRLVR